MRRLVVLVFAGCTFSVPSSAPQDARTDTSVSDASDAPLDVDAAADGISADAPAMAQISFVGGDSDAGGSLQATLTIPQAISDGDLCVLGVGTNGGTVATVTDTGNNTFTAVSIPGGATVYVAANMRASTGDVITVRFSSGTGYAVVAAVYRGLSRTAPVDATSGGSGNGTALDSGAFSTVHPHVLVVGVALSDGAMAASGGATKHAGGMYSLIEGREVTTAGSYRAMATASSSVNWRLSGLALKAAD